MRDKKKIVLVVITFAIYGIMSNNTKRKFLKRNGIPEKLNELIYYGNHNRPCQWIKFDKIEQNINLEIYDNKYDKIINKIIGIKTKEVPYDTLHGLRIVGGPEVRKYSIEMMDGSSRYIKGKIFGVNHDRGSGLIMIDTPDTIIRKFKDKYESKGIKIILNESDLELVYYKPEGMDRLIPMYQIGNPKSGPIIQKTIDNFEKGNDIRLLGMYFPANDKYKNDFSIKNFKIKQSSHQKESDENVRLNTYIIKFMSKDDLNINKLNIFGNFKVNKKSKNNRKYVFECTGNLELEKIDIFVDYINEYDVSTTIKIVKKNRKDRLSRTNKSNTIDSTSINDRGIKLSKDSIGASCYNYYINYMNNYNKTKAINKYKWTNTSALLNYQVLEKTWSFTYSISDTHDRLWLQRWIPAFNYLHLICGFKTNISVGTHKNLKYFVENMYEHEKTVRKSWFDAADTDQPDGTQVVVMGPVIRQDLEGDFNSYNYLDTYRLAYYNDYISSTGKSPGKDVKKLFDSSNKSKDIVAWWRVVHTV